MISLLIDRRVFFGNKIEHCAVKVRNMSNNSGLFGKLKQAYYGTSDVPETKTQVQRDAAIARERLEDDIIDQNSKIHAISIKLKKQGSKVVAFKKAGKKRDAMMALQAYKRIEKQLSVERNVLAQLDVALQTANTYTDVKDTTEALKHANELQRDNLDKIDIKEVTNAFDDLGVTNAQVMEVQDELFNSINDSMTSFGDDEELYAELDAFDLGEDGERQDIVTDNGPQVVSPSPPIPQTPVKVQSSTPGITVMPQGQFEAVTL